MVRLELLGGFSLLLDGQPCVLPTRKAQALLAYLAVPPGRHYTRDKLTALLWGEMPDAQARQNFRQTLSRLRRTLGDAVLVAQHDTVALDPSAVTVDVSELEAALRIGDRPALEHVAALYTGDLLDGFRVDEAPFEEWHAVQRERLHELALEGLARLLRDQMKAEQVETATRTALKILALDPLQEAVHRAAMRLLARQGRRAAALQQYQACVGWLERELGAEPEEETRTLYRELLRGSQAGRESARPPGGPSTTPLGERRSQPASNSPMIGRGDAMTAMRQALEHALDDGGRVVLVTGEAGIGKTRLIQEFSAEAMRRGLLVLSAWCHETEQPLPFRPWIDALRDSGTPLASLLRDETSVASRASLARVFPELAGANEVPVTTSDEHAVLFEALSDLVRRLTDERPLVIVLEDLHWADAMSTRLLAFLGRRLRTLPVLIVGSGRTEEVSQTPLLERALDELRTANALDEVALGTLSRDDSLALARALRFAGKRQVSLEAIGDDVWTLSEGNPFVIVETMRAFKEGPGGPPAMPKSVRQFVSARLARMSEPARRILSAAAVIGRACSFRLLAQSAGLSEMEGAAAIEELVRRRVLDMAGARLVIAHDRIRQVVQDELAAPRRIALHGAIGRALETLHATDLDDVANEIGHHALRAGDVERAIVHLERFATVATRRYALDAAIDARRQALEAATDLPPSVRDRRQLEIGARLGVEFSLAGRHRDALEVLQAHVPLVQRVGDPALTSDHYFRLAIASQYFGQHAEARAAAVAAIENARQARDDERTGKGHYAVAMMDVSTGAIASAIDHATRATALLATPAMRHWCGLNYWILTWAHMIAGTLSEALENSERCAAIARETQDRRLAAFGAYITAVVHASIGDAEAAMAWAQHATEAASASDPVSKGLALFAMGYAQYARGDAHAVIDVLSQLLARTTAVITRARALSLLAEAQRVVGDAAASTTTAREALASAEAHNMPMVAGGAQRTLGRIARAAGDLARGEDYLVRALESFRRGEATLEMALTRLDLARALVDRNARDEAHTQITEAVRVFLACGAHPRVTEAREVARELGLEVTEA